MNIKIGPAGNSDAFYEAGYKRTDQAPQWLHSLGLNAMEYSCGRGVTLGEKAGREIAEKAAEFGITMSLHAPYFINLAADDDVRIENNFKYFSQSAQAARYLGAKRIVFHPGAVAKGVERACALENALTLLTRIRRRLDENGLEDLILCPETLGKENQLGDLKEVIALCSVDDRVIPAIDFAHLHARGLGCLNTIEDFAAVLDALEAGVGEIKAKSMHVHFCRIEFTNKGEKKHWTFADTQYGPEFAPLAKLIIERNYCPHIICESKGTMAQDALDMKRMLQERQISLFD